MNRYPKKLEGTTTWNRSKEREAEFILFVLRSPEEFFFEFDYERARYSGTFQKNANGIFSGTFSAKGDGGSRAGHGQCCVVKESNGSYVLNGTWNEDGIKYESWYAELTEIE